MRPTPEQASHQPTFFPLRAVALAKAGTSQRVSYRLMPRGFVSTAWPRALLPDLLERRLEPGQHQRVRLLGIRAAEPVQCAWHRDELGLHASLLECFEHVLAVADVDQLVLVAMN